ncbi:Uncharacterised protein [Vibrio cholerae]|nr:Uncharacterised protein [Vibrio cholerae]
MQQGGMKGMMRNMQGLMGVFSELSNLLTESR